MSGLPRREATFLRKRSPRFHKALRNMISCLVSTLRLLRLARELDSEVAWSPLNDATLGDDIRLQRVPYWGLIRDKQLR